MFLDDGYDADLTSTSALLASAEVLQRGYGFSPATVDGSCSASPTEGAVVILHLPDGTDFDPLGDRPRGLGYTRPTDETGCGTGGADRSAAIGADLTPELQYLALDADDGLVLASDTAGFPDRPSGDVRTATGPGGRQRDGGRGRPGAAVRGDLRRGPTPARGWPWAGRRRDRAQANSCSPRPARSTRHRLRDVRRAGRPRPGGPRLRDDDEARDQRRHPGRARRGPAPGQGGTSTTGSG